MWDVIECLKNINKKQGDTLEVLYLLLNEKAISISEFIILINIYINWTNLEMCLKKYIPYSNLCEYMISKNKKFNNSQWISCCLLTNLNVIPSEIMYKIINR